MVHQDARERYFQNLSMMEKAPVADLLATPLETEWLWLLNAGSMDARIRSGITNAENLPGTPVQVVELLGKVRSNSCWTIVVEHADMSIFLP